MNAQTMSDEFTTHPTKEYWNHCVERGSQLSDDTIIEELGVVAETGGLPRFRPEHGDGWFSRVTAEIWWEDFKLWASLRGYKPHENTRARRMQELYALARPYCPDKRNILLRTGKNRRNNALRFDKAPTGSEIK